MGAVISGAVAMASAVAALFFLKYWRQTRDRFFLMFALAFAIDSAGRFTLALIGAAENYEPYTYLTRLFTFGLIIAAVIDKNSSQNSD
jgi:hypothetical protein